MSKKLKIWKKALLCGAAALFTSNVYAQSQIIAPFKNGDRVAFVGNSITDGGHYHSYIWLYYMTHFPDMRITCYNVGIGGDVAKQIARRFDDDVLRRNPTVVTLTWGMNDTGYFEWFYPNAEQTFKTRLDTSIKYYHEIEGNCLIDAISGLSSSHRLLTMNLRMPRLITFIVVKVPRYLR